MKGILRIIYDVWREVKPIVHREVRKCNAGVPRLKIAHVILSGDEEVAGVCDVERNSIIISVGVLERVASEFKLSERSLKCLIFGLIMHEIKHYVDIVCEGMNYMTHKDLMEKRANEYEVEWREKCFEGSLYKYK